MIYLDNSATTRTLDAATETAHHYMTQSFFNPSAAYSAAVESERAVEAARTRLAAALGAEAEEVIFTSGGTESNNAMIALTNVLVLLVARTLKRRIEDEQEMNL